MQGETTITLLKTIAVFASVFILPYNLVFQVHQTLLLHLFVPKINQKNPKMK